MAQKNFLEQLQESEIITDNNVIGFWHLLRRFGTTKCLLRNIHSYAAKLELIYHQTFAS